MKHFVSPQGEFTLHRYPVQKNDPLRAWDAADEYLLTQLQDQQLLSSSVNLVILNDAFGALSIALAEYKPSVVTDSFISQQGIIENSAKNNIPTEQIQIQDSLQPLNNTFDLVLLKLPKNLAMLEDQLFRLRKHCNEKTIILAAAMSKHIHTSTLKLFEHILGPTRTTRARKKARLIITEFNHQLKPGDSPYPSKYVLQRTGETYINHANVFSREKLDIGSHFMLQHIPQSAHYQQILDLACGNGVLGIAASRLNPQAKLCFVDESYMAIESARQNVQHLLIKKEKRKAGDFEFKVTDCLQGIKNSSIDLIINNPPFHQQHAVGDFIAWQLFKESRHKLNTDGELIIVGNRHLGYHVKLKRLFGNCQVLASNKKFVILKSTKQQ